jgi:hypothetical protein
MKFSTASLMDLEPPVASGLLVANLPYGERIGALPALYKEVGRALRERFSAWRLALLVPAAAPVDALGLIPERAVAPSAFSSAAPLAFSSVALKNGALDVRLLLFAARR